VDVVVDEMVDVAVEVIKIDKDNWSSNYK
jgi:hypothetical protein